MSEMNPENNASQSPTGFNLVVDLIHEHGSVAKIPDEILASVGYRRSDDGTLAPIGFERDANDLDAKNERRPFDSFTVNLDTEQSLRSIGGPLIERFKSIEDKLVGLTRGLRYNEDSSDYLSETEFQNQVRAVGLLVGCEMNWYHDSTPLTMATFNGKNVVRLSAILGLTDFPYRPLKRSDYEVEESLLSELEHSSFYPEMEDDEVFIGNDDGVISLAKVTKLSKLIERDRSYYTDVDELYKVVDENIGRPSPYLDQLGRVYEHEIELQADSYGDELDVDKAHEEVEEYLQELRESGVNTIIQLQMLMVAEFLDENFPIEDFSYRQDFLECQTTAEAALKLREVLTDKLAQTKRNFVAAKLRLKQNPFGSEGRTEAEQNLSEAKDRISSVNAMLGSIVELYERPLLLARKANKLYDELQQIIHTNGNGSIALTLDARIDPVLDRDPGVVSRDCTEGKPLPFLDPGNDLYNVKVFRDQEHIGNVYLLQVKDKEDKPQVWHLDAIQIPVYADWSKAAPAILEGFANQAKQRGVKAITINNQAHHISNYDYVAEAFKALTIKEYGTNSKLHRIITQANPTESLINARPDEIEHTPMQLVYSWDSIRRLM